MLFLNVKESRDVSAQTFMHIMPIVIQPEKIFTVPQLNLGLWKTRYKRYQNIKKKDSRELFREWLTL